MAVIADYVLDKSLEVLDTEADRIDITSQLATTFTAVSYTHLTLPTSR